MLAFVASVILALRDRSNWAFAYASVRTKLLSRSDLDDTAFCCFLHNENEQIAVDVRSSVARFFNIPQTKIYPSDNLESDLESSQLTLGLQGFVWTDVVGKIVGNRIHSVLPIRPLKTLDEFIREVARVAESEK